MVSILDSIVNIIFFLGGGEGGCYDKFFSKRISTLILTKMFMRALENYEVNGCSLDLDFQTIFVCIACFTS